LTSKSPETVLKRYDRLTTLSGAIETSIPESTILLSYRDEDL
jgi:hypothetical protein